MKEIKGHTIEFFEQDHIYLINGEETLSATQIATFINPFRKMKIPNHILKKAGEKGTMIHECIDEYLKTGKIMISDQAKEYPYFEAFLGLHEHLQNRGLKIHNHEEIAMCKYDIEDTHINLVGTIDLVCELDGKMAIIDWKTSSMMTEPEWRLQLSIYKYLVEYSYGYSDIDLYIGWIKKNGEYQLIKFEPLSDKYMHLIFMMLLPENRAIVDRFNLLLYEIFGDEMK